MAAKDRISVGWLTCQHHDEVLAIDQASFDFPWSRQDFQRVGDETNVSGIVAELDRFCRRPLVIGYAVYELNRRSVDILRIAVDRQWRRQGVGSLLLNHLKSRLNHQRRSRIRLDCAETNVRAQLFYRANGFEGVMTLPNYYASTGEDAYRFVYRLPPQRPLCPAALDAACEGVR